MADTIKLILQPSGRQGLPGPQGIPGETGPAGADGKTPVRGTDYWTPEDKAEVVAEAVEQVKADAGSGLPEGAKAYQQLVTDGDGVAKWEDRTHYASIQLSRELFAEKYGETTYLAELYLGVRISSLSGKKVIVTINDTDAYESECYLDRTVGAYKIDLGDGYSIKQSVTSDQAVFLGGKAEEYYSVKIEVLNGAETVHPLDQKYLPDTVATKEYVDSAVANGGSGLPEGATAHQMLVTDADGNAKWEDRTHYEHIVTTTLWENQTLEFSEMPQFGEGLFVAYVSCTGFSVSAGESYKVIWDGTEYNITTKNAIIGDATLVQGNATPATPFVISSGGLVDKAMVVTTSTEATHTMSVYTTKPQIFKIDRKFLPESAFVVTFDEDDSGLKASATLETIREMYHSGYAIIGRSWEDGTLCCNGLVNYAKVAFTTLEYVTDSTWRYVWYTLDSSGNVTVNSKNVTVT